MPSNVDIRLPGKNVDRAASRLLNFDFGATGSLHNLLATDHLSGPATESWLIGGDIEPVEFGAFTGLRGDQYQMLSCQREVSAGDVRQTTRELYEQLIEHVSSSSYPQPVRFWNYVPAINHLSNPADADSEVYRQFCWGRAEALQSVDFPLPAATAVGCEDGRLHLSLLSATDEISVAHFENPRQVSAYHYPRQYGPRSPSFARASVIQANGASLLLLSGTASIVKHETRHPGDLAAQMRETACNIESLLTVAAQNTGGPVTAFEPVSSRCYLRSSSDSAEASEAFAQSLPTWPQPAILANDICRSELVMEIEAVFRGT